MAEEDKARGDERDAFSLPYGRLEVRAASADLLALAREQAPDPELFDRYPPLFARALISNSQRDAYYTRMMPSTLRNYAADAEAGVTVLDSHNARSQQTILGRSLTGRYYDGRGGGGGPRVESDFYIVTGDDGPGDRARMLIGTGTVRDVSVGFYRVDDTRIVCSFCGKDMLDFFSRMLSDGDACWHYPGQKVLPLDESGKPKKGAEPIVVEGHIERARLGEYSPVYDGATPGAGIIGVKARMLADAGRLRPDEAELLEAQYRIHLPAARRVYTPGTPGAISRSHQEGDDMGHEDGARARATATSFDAELSELLTERGFEIAEGAAFMPHIRAALDERDALRAEVERLRPLAEQIEGLKDEASDGRAYRADLIEQVVTEGVRAFAGSQPGFDEKDEREELKGLPLSALKRRLARYAAIAGDGKKYPTGRGSSDLAHDPPNGKQVDRPVSIAAYRV